MDDDLRTADAVQRLCEELVVWAAGQEEVEAVYLYGSTAEGRANALSDVDVAVLARVDQDTEYLWRLEDRWAGHFADWLDLRVLNLAPVGFQFEVITRGRRLWCRDLVCMAEFESWVRRRYWDLEPLLQEEWRAFQQRLWERRDETERQQYQDTLAEVRAVHQRVREASEPYAGDVSE